MKMLLDTNVFIPLEPGAPADVEEMTDLAAKLHESAQRAQVTLYAHPASLRDFARDRQRERSRLRGRLLKKYPQIQYPPVPSERLEDLLSAPAEGSNDWVDLQLIAALEGEAVDFLVTEDRKLQKKAERASLGRRTLTLSEAISAIEDLFDKSPTPPPAVEAVTAYAIDQGDPILESFRQDYPGFDDWLSKSKREHRKTWIIRGRDRWLAGFCIAKIEDEGTAPVPGRVLKLCSFKVAERHNGFRFGELLLKAIFDFATTNGLAGLYVTVFDRHERLMDLFQTFGFNVTKGRTALGELILEKPMLPRTDWPIGDPLGYHVRRGPFYFWEEVPWYLVPIQPKYGDVLFPETSVQSGLFPGVHPFGNAIRKAYLCHSPKRTLECGAVLVFYRSAARRGLIAVGVVEETVRSSSPEHLAQVVVRRTVYSFDEIVRLCQKEVLAVLFRQARTLDHTIPSSELSEAGVFERPPQSIMEVRGGGLVWLKRRINP